VFTDAGEGQTCHPIAGEHKRLLRRGVQRLPLSVGYCNFQQYTSTYEPHITFSFHRLHSQWTAGRKQIVYPMPPCSAFKHSTGSNRAARTAGTVPKAIPIAPETISATTAEIQEVCSFRLL
jgi:hypothetical protein